jgi:ABC-type glycerol-3-phosphate transport system permease component
VIKNHIVLTSLRYLGLITIAGILFLPIYWLIMSSFRPSEDIFKYSSTFSLSTFFPERITIDNYIDAIEGKIGMALLNSLFVSVSTVILGVFVNSLAGFALAVFEFPLKRAIFVSILMSFMMPFESIVIPLYSVMKAIGWIDTYAALILPDVAGGLIIFLFYQFFRGIPKEIYEAARVDGASWFQIYLKMTMPLSGPTIATASLMMFIHQWDAFFWPLVATSSERLAVVQVAIARNMTLEQANWGSFFAAASLAILIAMVPFFFLQRHYVRVVVMQSDR